MSTASNTSLDPAKYGIRKGEIAVILATRGRPEMFAEEMESLKATTAQKDKTVLWVYVDDDDLITRKAIDAGKFPDPGFPVNWHIAPRTPGLGECHQAIWNASRRASEVYMITCDDSRFDTPNWDNIVRAEYEKYPDGILLAFAHDPNTAGQATYPFLGWGWLATLGYIFPGHFAYWFDDKWVEEIGLMAGRSVKLPISINPIGGKGRTQRMRGLPFWMRYFQLTLNQRKADAARLIAALDLNEKDRAARMAALDALAGTLANENDKFSDLYCVFQEERHTDVPLEERNRFNPLYFRKEAQAVSQLITFAEAEIAKGRHAEAMSFLDATQLSEMRLRAAQMMKAQCLKALGQPAEAERISREALAIWPQMSTARRIFKFGGMFANEAKRLAVGLVGGKGKAKVG